MPEGDTLEIAARRMAPLVGVPVAVEAPDPRARALGLPTRLADTTIERVEARGKHLLIRFSNGLSVHSHLRMTGRWDVHPLGRRWGRAAWRAWLVLRTATHEAVQFDGPVLELLTDAQIALHPVLRRLGADPIDDDFDARRVLAALRGEHPTRAVGDALLDQRVVAGIGNVWRSELLWARRIDPRQPLGRLDDDALLGLVEAAREGLRGQADRGHGRRPSAVYGRAGSPCPRCGARIATALQGDEGRRVFWCPSCQR